MPESVRSACEDDMVLEFIKSEIDSPRFSRFYPKNIREGGAVRKRLVDNADIYSAADNARRRELLGYRGYNTRKLLFAGFPSEVGWQWEQWTQPELKKMKYAQLSDTTVWIHLSAGTRLVGAGARTLDGHWFDDLLATSEIPDPVRIRIREIAEQIRTVAALYARGQRLPRPIAVTDESDVVLLEGHVRTTAFALTAGDGPLEILVGHSPAMRRWQLF